MNRQSGRQSASSPLADPALAALAAAPADKPVILLHSGRPHPRWATRSLLATPVAWYRYTADGRSEISDLRSEIPNLRSAIPDLKLTHNVWRDLRTLLNHPDLPGKWFGYIAYDIARYVEPAKLAHTQRHPWPVVELGYCPDVEAFDVPAHPKPRTEEQRDQAPDVPTSDFPLPTSDLSSNFSRLDYERAVGRALDYISAGDVFQVNLAQRFTTEHSGNPRSLFARLASISPAWYGAYMEVGSGKWEVESGKSEVGTKPHHDAQRLGGDTAQRPAGDTPQRLGKTHHPPRALLSTSPELFLRVEGNRVITRPIKGTLKRSETGNQQSEIEQLRASAKDTAELNMIVDLLRNDLGRVCSYGSVRVENAREIETHPTIHHATATIAGHLHHQRDVVDLLRATLPGGSITGAPKVRAMQIIDELEPHPRGPYCGCIGYISKDDVCLNIAIRTMVLERMSDVGCGMADVPNDSWPPHPTSHIHHPTYRASFHVGGGIVADSQPPAEYDETIAKAQAILRALGAMV